MAIFLVSFLLLMICGAPIAFSLLGSSMLYFFINDMPLVIIVQRLIAGADSFVLLAVPGFILAGNIMNSTGVTDRIFDFCGKLVGHIKGGLAHANVLASIIFAGMSGAAIADAGGLGAIELKAMKDAGYDEDFSLAVTAASSVVGPIIPPSIPAVVYGTVASVSIGRLFMAGAVPGLIMGLCISILIYFICKKKGFKSQQRESFKNILKSFQNAFFALLAPVVIIGGILIGIFTATEAAIIAVFYAIILGFIYNTTNLSKLLDSFLQSLATTCSVMFIVIAATAFGYVLSSARFPQLIASIFLEFTSNKYLILIFINLFLILVGMFMDSTPAIIILTPIFLPVIKAVGIDPVHFGIVMIVNLMIGLMTPPVGMVLYVLSNVAKVPFERISKSMIPFLIILFILLFIFTFSPGLVNWLPKLIYG
jgi:tripartite ATP-independent transporter DctM subunit